MLLFLRLSFVLILGLPSALLAEATNMTEIRSLYLKSQCYKRFLAKDYTQSMSCTENFANRGDIVAEYYLGLMYYKGRGTRQDYKKALFWFNKSADHAYPPAENSLGVLYDNGQGVIQNFRTAFSWYLKAASKGHVIAQNNIGQMYYKGRGVLSNYKQAYVWFLIAASNGHKEAMQLRDSLSVTLLPKQLESAQDEAKKIADAIDAGSFMLSENKVPEVKAPVNKVPETKVSETKVPVGKVPATKALETKVPVKSPPAKN